MASLVFNSQEKVALVTGANSGMGYEIALALARMGTTVVLISRNRESGEEARQRIVRQSGNEKSELFVADLSSQASIRHVVAAFEQHYDRLDVLVNNAGLFEPTRSETVDGYESMFAVNHLAPFLLTNLLLNRLRASASARVVNVNSGAHRQSKLNLDDLQSTQHFSLFTSYGQSKLANLLFTYELARRLEGTGVTVNAADPGGVATKMTSPSRADFPVVMRLAFFVMKNFAATPEHGAQTAIYLASSPEVEGVTGKYFVRSREKPSAKLSYDRQLAQQLWQVSEKMTGLHTEHMLNVQ